MLAMTHSPRAWLERQLTATIGNDAAGPAGSRPLHHMARDLAWHYLTANQRAAMAAAARRLRRWEEANEPWIVQTRKAIAAVGGGAGRNDLAPHHTAAIRGASGSPQHDANAALKQANR